MLLLFMPLVACLPGKAVQNFCQLNFLVLQILTLFHKFPDLYFPSPGGQLHVSFLFIFLLFYSISSCSFSFSAISLKSTKWGSQNSGLKAVVYAEEKETKGLKQCRFLLGAGWVMKIQKTVKFSRVSSLTSGKSFILNFCILL